MLTKGMSYWADQEAVKEAAAEPERERADRIGGANGHTVRHSPGAIMGASSTRNPRNWVTPSPSPFPGAHFATYPVGLIEPFIKATCPAQCCPECGAGWAPVVEREAATPGQAPGWAAGAGTLRNDGQRAGRRIDQRADVHGYRPTCQCGRADWVAGVVLDPFMGAGTTALVADRLGRDCIGLDLNPAYADMARQRLVDDAPLFAEVSA